MADNDEINIAGIDKAEVLRALYNASRPIGLGVFHFKPEEMTRDQAALLLENRRAELRGMWFDYVQGRIMKVDLSGDTLNPRLYDRDNGQGAAKEALEHSGLIGGKS